MDAEMTRRSPFEGVLTRLGVHHPTFAVCITQLGSCLLQTTFMFYYVKVFLNHFKISDTWFQIAQVLFMVWNSINDPLFGYYQDVVGSGWMKNRCVFSTLKERRKAVLYGAPLYALSFLLPWFPWGGEDSAPWVVGLHLITALFFYDALFSFVLLAWCSLFAEISTEHSGRVRAVQYNQVMALIGLNVVTVVEKSSNSLQDFASFQFVTVILAMIGFVCIAYTGLYAPQISAQAQNFKHVDSYNDIKTEGGNWKEAWRLTKQVFRSPDFLFLAAMNFLHSCRSTSHLNFMAIFTEGLIPRSVLPLGSWHISAFYGLCAVIPQILVICSSKLINERGPHALMMYSFGASIMCSLCVYAFGNENPYVLMTYMLIDSICVHSFSPLIMIMFSDVVDDDMIRHRRQSPISSVIFSINALLTKPAQSLTPMLIVYFLGEEYNEFKLHKHIEKAGQYDNVRYSMFSILCLCPSILAILQYIVFGKYKLKDRHNVSAECALDIPCEAARRLTNL